MVSIEATELASIGPGSTGIPLDPRLGRRADFEAVGLLLAILAVLFILALVIGLAPLG